LDFLFGFYYLGAMVEDMMQRKNKNKTYFILYFIRFSLSLPHD